MSQLPNDTNPNDIAVIGMGLRVPGARTLEDFWANLRDGVESVRTFSPEEMVQAGEDPDRMRRKNFVPRGGDLPGMELFDADFFGLSPKEAAVMDPQHRQFLECTWEAFENAARPPESAGGPVGVFAGCGMGSYFYFNVCSHRDLVDQVGLFLLRHTGNDKDFLATRASFLFDLHGPSVNIQTACSTSLVAVHSACQSLLSGECEMALAGGVTIEFPHRTGYLFQEGEVLSPDGHCRAFDHRAAGTVFGSGTGVVVLRRLADAIADGDPIRAVIKGTAVNNDGASKAGYLAPSVSGQAEAIVEAQGLAGVSADTIGYVECHGTGTYLGDPIEIEALTEAFRQSTNRTGFCRIGSVKTNIGHLDTAAGVVSLIKAVLALENEQIPPTLNYEKPNPAIDFPNTPFVVNDRLSPWPRGDVPRRAAINSLGVGGTNAHAIIEEAPRRAVNSEAADVGPQILVLSAKSKKVLEPASKRLAAHLESNDQDGLADVAHSLIVGRRPFEYRHIVAVGDRADAVSVLRDADSRRPHTHQPIEGLSGAVFMFPGGGAQYPLMGKRLYETEPLFRSAVDEGLGYLPEDVAAVIRRCWLDADSRQDKDALSRLLQVPLQLPAILIFEVALARLWMSWGVVPAAMIGHSMGQNAAACIAGVTDFKSAVELVHARGKLVDEIKGGAMLSVPMAADDLAPLLPDDVEIAVINAPGLCVVSGLAPAIERFQGELVAKEIDATRIPIDAAGHSRLLDPILERFGEQVRSVRLSPPSIPIISNVSGTWLTDEEATDPDYWVGHLRSTVRFADGMKTLSEDGTRAYVEVGPGRMMTSLAKAQGGIDANQIINSQPHSDDPTDDRLHFLTAVGRAWAVGLPVPIERMWEGQSPRRVSLPTYAFQEHSYFLPRISSGAMGGPPRLSRYDDVADWGWRIAWKPTYADTVLGADETPQSFLVFVDGSQAGSDIVQRLRQRGHTVTTVGLGDAFGRTDKGNYVLCPEAGREGYDALIADLVERGALPERIVHTWLVTEDETHRPGSSFFHRNQERGFYSLFFLAQSLGNIELAEPIQLIALTNGMHRLGSEKLSYPDKSTVLGPVQVIPREMPGVFVRCIDLEQAPTRSGVEEVLRSTRRLANGFGAQQSESGADLLWDDLFAEHGNDIVAYRGGRRFVRTHQRQPLPAAAKGEELFRDGGVYLVTGGLGGIATICAEDLARRANLKFVLVGRLDLPERDEWSEYLAAYGPHDRLGRAMDAIQRIEAAGGEVLYARGDVTNPQAMRRVVNDAKTRFGAINGVIHAAGVVHDDLIAMKSQSDIESVFAPKVLGTMVLDEVLKDEALDLVILFSSSSTDTAPAGQVDYVAANAYLNAYAEKFSGHEKTRVIAVHWGIWNEVGMAARALDSADGDAELGQVERARQPLFDRRLDGTAGGWLEFRCSPADDWILNEHRLGGGEAVWPGTGYLEIAAEAAREHGLRRAVRIDDLTFLRPLHVKDDEARIVRVRHEAASSSGLRLVMESRVESPQGPAWLAHAEATVLPTRGAPPDDLDIAAISDRCTDLVLDERGEAIRSAQEDHLRFGPRWAVLREARFGEGEAIARLALDPAYHRDCSQGMILHPALMDIATGYAMHLIEGYDPKNGLWVPATYGEVRIHGAIVPEIYSHVRLSQGDEADLGPEFASFDVTLCDRSGKVLVEIERFTVKHLGRDVDFAANLEDTSAARPEGSGGSDQRDLSPAMERLARQVELGITPADGVDALLRALGTGLPQVVLTSIDLESLKAAQDADESEEAGTSSFERPEMDSEFVAPRNDMETTLAGFWTELLGVQKIGIHDSFFDLGGHSLIAVRLFRKIKKAYSVDLPISVLFDAPTIAQCAGLLEEAGVSADGAQVSDGANDNQAPSAARGPRMKHVVQMHPGRSSARTPFFICSGMFGNILNLRYLATQIGQDRPVYGLQARGLYGGEPPHETFEEMARDYLAELRTVQTHGPYLLGGFSGGGLVAYEMSQQLTEAGEEVVQVVMLDTPYPDEPVLTALDKVAMKLQDIQRERSAFLGSWVRRRIAWELEKRRKGNDSDQLSSEQFHNEEIEAAFRRALGRYVGKPYGGSVINLRPKLDVVYQLSDGRMLNRDRVLLKADNGWTPFVEKLRIIEVPGDHDNMVLEPNVRVLAAIIREELLQAERDDDQRQEAAE